MNLAEQVALEEALDNPEVGECAIPSNKMGAPKGGTKFRIRKQPASGIELIIHVSRNVAELQVMEKLK